VTSPLLSVLSAIGLLFPAAAIANAQDQPGVTQNGNNPANQDGSEMVQIAGCLERGPAADQYTLHSEGPQSSELRSHSVSLSVHLDQQVIVTVLKSTYDDGVVTVIDLRMDSTSCISW
jgi:hypothetical protein